MILIVGMARSGIAAARLLKNRGCSVFVSDSGTPSSTAELDALNIPYETGRHTLSLFADAEEIVVSPGVPLDIPALTHARQNGVPIISELELASRYLKGEIIGITGSNGKTTTTTLVGEILKAGKKTVQVGGNIGTAMCGLVETSTEDTINVIEVSSFQLDGIARFRPNVGALLNITPDHLDRYPNFEAYRSSKFQIFRNQRPNEVAVLNRDDPQVFPPPVAFASQQRFFSRTQTVDSGAYRWGQSLYLGGQAVMPVVDVALRGEHNVENVLAAMCIADCYGVSARVMAEAIRNFRGVEHRIEFVATVDGVEFFNDSKATNVDSSIKAVESFDRNIILILGGKDKGASYEPLIRAMQGRVKHVVLIGAAADKIGEALGKRFPKSRAASMSDAVRQAAAYATSGDVVLLSPACASFDMFNNYEHRGSVFKEAVQGLVRQCQER